MATSILSQFSISTWIGFLGVALFLFVFRSKMQKILDLILHPVETLFLVLFFMQYQSTKVPTALSAAEQFCFATLPKVSRSFAAVIFELTPELRNPVISSST